MHRRVTFAVHFAELKFCTLGIHFRRGNRMAIRSSFVLGLCVAIPLSSFADFRYDETTRITGGSIVSMTKFAGAFSKQAHQMTDPVNSTILVKGNRMAHINQDSTEIIDLDKETITKIDHAQKKYSVVTFQEMKAAMEQAMEKAKAQAPPQPAPASTAKTEPPPPEMKFKVNVTNTGASKQVAGLAASESILKMSMEAKDQKSGQTGTLAMTNDMWMAPEIPGYGEVRDFNRRMALKMGTIFSGAVPSTVSPQLLGAQPGMLSGMADMQKEMSKLKGVPVSQVMRMGTTADGSALPAASEAPLPASDGPSAGSIADEAAANAANSATNAAASTAENKAASKMGNFGGVASGIGNLGGFGGFHKKKKAPEPEPAPAAQPTTSAQNAAAAAVLMESTTEMTRFSSASVDTTLFDVP
ncbi:MAG: hypothetical protein QOJ41_135, partial [Acidobacteriaceae bacterium]|nr:hypothetical protein [Acidobacteriaceae bacterium]